MNKWGIRVEINGTVIVPRKGFAAKYLESNGENGCGHFRVIAELKPINLWAKRLNVPHWLRYGLIVQ